MIRAASGEAGAIFSGTLALSLSKRSVPGQCQLRERSPALFPCFFRSSSLRTMTASQPSEVLSTPVPTTDPWLDDPDEPPLLEEPPVVADPDARARLVPAGPAKARRAKATTSRLMTALGCWIGS